MNNKSLRNKIGTIGKSLMLCVGLLLFSCSVYAQQANLLASNSVSPGKHSITVHLQKTSLSEATQPTALQETVSGTVTDAATGNPLVGVNILVVGTSTGTATDGNGHYSLTVSSLQATLRFSYIGYKTQTVQINGRTTVNIAMKSAIAGLNQVVVTALGRKSTTRSLGYATEQISAKSLEKSQQTSVLGSLEGKMSGVQISQSSGTPGASSRIIIRGNSSLTGNNQPLVIVDGVPLSNAGGGGSVFTGVGPSRLSDIDPSMIKSINVLKSAAARHYMASVQLTGLSL